MVIAAVSESAGISSENQDESTAVQSPRKILSIFSPRPGPFWDRIAAFASKAAQDLNVRLDLYHFDDDPDKLVSMVEKAIDGGSDGLIFPGFQGVDERVLSLAESGDVPSVVINSALANSALAPREQYKQWIGSVLPDDVQAGKLLIRRLVAIAKSKGLTTLNILAIEGNPKRVSSQNRVVGLKSFIDHRDDVVAFSVETGNWSPELAAEIVVREIRKNPDISIVWCANDGMAIAVAEAVKGLNLSQPPIIGGVDWDFAATDAIRRGEMHVSVGGHFLDGAWAVILLNDYLSGEDFAHQQLRFKSLMLAAEGKDLDRFAPYFSMDPKAVDFARHSLALNPDRLYYNFDLQTALATEGDTGKRREVVNLTAAERDWLVAHPTIRLGVDPAYPPFEFIGTSGAYHGMAADYVKLIEDRLGIELQVLPGLTWSHVVEGAKNRTVDLVPVMTDTPQRREFLNFTQPYLTFPQIIVTRKDHPPVTGMKDFVGNIVAVPAGFADIEEISSKLPSVELLIVDSVLAGLLAVSVGKADATQGNLAVFSYFIQKNSLLNLKVAARSDLADGALAFGVRKDWPELLAILDKTLESITPDEHQKIRARWVSIGGADVSDPGIQLTADEVAWLEEHRDTKVRVMVGTWPPFHYVEDGRPKGLAFDYVTTLLGSLGLEVEPVPILWKDALASIDRFEKIDVLPTIARSAEREKMVNITRDYLSFPLVIFMRKDSPFVGALSDLYGQTVALENGFIVHKRLVRDHPQINLMPLATTKDALEAVSLGRADAYVGNLAVGSYIIETLGLTNLEVAAPTTYKRDIQAIGVRRDWPELASMIDKSLAAMTDAQHAALREKALSVRFETGIDIETIVLWAGLVGMIVVIVIAVIVVWSRSLGREVAERKRTEAVLAEKEAQLRAALKSMSGGLMMTDKDLVMQVVNDRLIEWYGFPRDLIRPGVSFRDLLRLRAERGDYGEGDPDDLAGDRLERFLDDRIQRWEDNTQDGRTIELHSARTDDGGIVVVANDVTERNQAEQALRDNLDELETFNRLAVGRELRMIELKREINDLLHGLGREPEYENGGMSTSISSD